jgi:hypothetical protein
MAQVTMRRWWWPDSIRPRWVRTFRLVPLVPAALLLGACASSHTSGNATTTTGHSSSTTPASSTTTPTSSTTVPGSAGLGGYLPLFPFSTASDVTSWEQSYRNGGHEPWHLDSGVTARSFAAYLGLGQLDTVIASHTDGSGAHVTIGAHVPETTQTFSAAVVHLVRWGQGPNAPWEVVGTDDTTFSLTVPAYASTTSSPTVAGGQISGVDENIRAQVHTLAATGAVGVSCCVAAGGSNARWQLQVPFSASPGSVVTISASTGGHVAPVERFTVTGARVSQSSTATNASCEGGAILPVVRTALPLPAPDTITSVDVRECGGGYARVSAVPSNLTCGKPGGSCHEDEQVFLKATGSSWTVIDNGTGIDCSGPSAPAADVPACRALGLT